MRRTVIIATLTLVTGIVLGILGNQMLSAQQVPVKRTILQQKNLEGVAGKEGIMYMAEIAPGVVAGRHYHSGPEFFYIMEGALVVEPDGQPATTVKTGESWYGPAGYIANQKNLSKTKSVKALVFIVAEKGKPLTTQVK